MLLRPFIFVSDNQVPFSEASKLLFKDNNDNLFFGLESDNVYVGTILGNDLSPMDDAPIYNGERVEFRPDDLSQIKSALEKERLLPGTIQRKEYLEVNEGDVSYIFKCEPALGIEGSAFVNGEVIGAKVGNGPWRRVKWMINLYLFIFGAKRVNAIDINQIRFEDPPIVIDNSQKGIEAKLKADEANSFRPLVDPNFVAPVAPTPASTASASQTTQTTPATSSSSTTSAAPTYPVPSSILPQPPVAMSPAAGTVYLPPQPAIPSRVAALLGQIEVRQRQAEEVVVQAMALPTRAYESLIKDIDVLEKSKQEAKTYDDKQDEDAQVLELKRRRKELIAKTEAVRTAIRKQREGDWVLLDPNPYEMLKDQWLGELVVKQQREIPIGTLTIEAPCLRGVRMMLAEHYTRFRSSFAWGPTTNACDGSVVFFQYDDNDTLTHMQPYQGKRIEVNDDTARKRIMTIFSRSHGKHLTAIGTGYAIVAMRKAKKEAQEKLAGFRGRAKNNQEAVPMWYVFLLA